MRHIKIDISHVKNLMSKLQQLPEKDMAKAYVSAINRTLDHTYTHTGRHVTQHYNVKAKDIRQAMTKRKANASSPMAWIQIRSRRFTLGRFLPGGLNSRSKVAKVKIKKSAGYKRVGGDPPAFVQRSPDGNTHVFRRQTRLRYPIDVLRTISPTQMVENINVSQKIVESAQTMLAKRLEHEIQYRLQRLERLKRR